MLINQPNKHHAQQHKSRNKTTSFYSYSIFTNFGKISCFFLYKGSLGGDRGKTGLRIGDRTQFHILLWIAFNEHPMLSLQPYYGSSSGAKVIILFERSKSIHIFLFWACSSLTKQIVASFVAPARKVRIRLRPSIEIICRLFLCFELFYYLCTHNL